MHPALSVILFTVLSGAGLGLYALLILTQLSGWQAALPPAMQLGAGALALGLVAAGLVSSTFHLANPKNAWRAATQFRYSWLSREAVLAMLFFPLASAYLLAAYLELPGAVQVMLAMVSSGLAWAILYSTAMIYACLKTIPQWHTPLVPAAYIANGHFSGALILLVLASIHQRPAIGYVALALATTAVAGAVKWIYFRKFQPAAGKSHTLASAIGMTAARAKLLDVGHTHGTFLTREFIFNVGRKRARQLRALFFLLSIVVPITIIALGASRPLLLGAAALSCLAGLMIERWLFFAEAQHVVRLFHGQQTV